MEFRVGVVGATGYIATPYRREIRSAGTAQIVALCARRRELLTAAATEDHAECATADWRDVVEHPDVNLIIVATPDALHRDAVMAAAAAGKHIVCEKPVGANADEAAQMLAAYRQTSLAHFVPFWTRYIPVFARAREIVQSGELGTVKAVVYRWHNPRPAEMPFTWRDDERLSAGGSIADVGSHAYDTLRWVLGQEATRVLAHADVIAEEKPDLGDINLDEALEWGAAHQKDAETPLRRGTAFDYAALAFEFSGGVVGTLVLSHAPFLRKGLAPEVEFHGTQASLSVDRIRNCLNLARSNQQIETIDLGEDPGFGNRFSQYVFPALESQIDGTHTGHPDLYDGWRVQQFTDAAACSAKSGGWIGIPTE